jgi:phage-related minor tail protein
MAEAQAALDKVRLLEQQLGANFDAMWIQFENKRLALQSLKLAFKAQAQAAEKSLKAYALGEGNLAQTLMISRLSSENLTAVEHMNLEVLELLALIRLDLHQMWDFDE